MGSPFQSTNLSKVSVVRTEHGAYQSLVTAIHAARFEFDRTICRTLVAATFARPKCFREDAFCTAEWHAMSGFSEQLMKPLEELTGGEFRLISEFLDALAKALMERSRIVHVMSARYDWDGSESFNRAIVFDMTKQDNFPKVPPYDIAWELIPMSMYVRTAYEEKVERSKPSEDGKE